MITLKDRIRNLNKLTKEIIDAEEIYISDLIELKKCCDNISEEIDSKYDDIRVDLD